MPQEVEQRAHHAPFAGGAVARENWDHGHNDGLAGGGHADGHCVGEGRPGGLGGVPHQEDAHAVLAPAGRHVEAVGGPVGHLAEDLGMAGYTEDGRGEWDLRSLKILVK